MSLFTFIQGLTGNSLIDSLMVFSAEYLVLVLPLVLVYLWWFFHGEQGKLDAGLVFYTSAGALAVSYLLGLLYSHPPPHLQGFDTILVNEPENAFPSQHTTVLVAAVWPLVYRNRRKLSVLVAAAAVLTGFARVYTGLHFPVDVGGAVLASLIGFGLVYLLEEWLEKSCRIVMQVEDEFYDFITSED